MTLVPVRLRPGINSVQTETLNEGGFSASKNVRFFEGLPQKDGGFVLFTDVPAVGIPRALRAWTALSGASYLAIAGTTGLYVYLSGVTYNLSSPPVTALVPISVSVLIGDQFFTIDDSVNNPPVSTWIQIRDPISVAGVVLSGVFQVISSVPGVSYTILNATGTAESTVLGGGVCRVVSATAGDPFVNILLPNHGLSTGDVAQFLNPLTVGGTTLSGNYLATVIDPDNYTIVPIPGPSSTQTVTENSGNIAITFIGTGTAWQDYNVSAAFLDNWGEFLMAVPAGGPLLIWQPSQGLNFPLALVGPAPSSNNVMFIASQEQMVVMVGTIDRLTGVFDPMLVRWCSVGDYTDWTPTAINQAGSFRLAIGSKGIAGLALPGQNLIWTDLALYTMQYIQFPLVWGFQPLGINCGAVSPHGMGILAGTVYWMGRNQFFFLSPSGGPETLTCPVWDDVFPNLDLANLAHVTCETNSFFGAISWSVPQTDGSFIQARLTIGAGEPGQWTASTYHHHTAWIDQNAFGAPIGGHEDGLIDQHDVGVDAFGAALPTSLTTGRIKIAEGDQMTFIRGVYPDIKWLKPGTLSLTGYFYDNPDKPPRVTRPYRITPTTQFVPLRGRGRDFAFKLDGNDVGSNWRLGLFRYFAQPDGRR